MWNFQWFNSCCLSQAVCVTHTVTLEGKEAGQTAGSSHFSRHLVLICFCSCQSLFSENMRMERPLDLFPPPFLTPRPTVAVSLVWVKLCHCRIFFLRGLFSGIHCNIKFSFLWMERSGFSIQEWAFQLNWVFDLDKDNLPWEFSSSKVTFLEGAAMLGLDPTMCWV